MMFTFTMYIRTVVEAYMILLLGSLHELYEIDFSGTDKILSFSISIISIILLISVCTMTFFVARKSMKEEVDSKKSYFYEVVKDTKPGRVPRLKIFVLLLRIILSVGWIVLSQSVPLIGRIVGYCCIQLLFAIEKTFVRPFEEITDNLIEVLNDWIYLGVCISLFFLRKFEDWSTKATFVIMVVLTANGLIIAIIKLID